ncbi:GIY-YIG nuclease family protein [Candidatus Saganbacteria bacterium]|uniref:GIY-YIG nuclease family protein n=1 Tax=Candidatus Saganbacteria bacterium TaxID=2575572 RepID=A0A9D6YVZ0_UNCSA|nr:GIY-YIG nuclease family protein [Candidatus Saganbacteria bacterium]
MFCVYVLASVKNGRYYTGSTRDLENRLKEHNAGKIKSTKAFIPYKIVYKETFSTYTEARKRELYIKKRKSRKYIEEFFLRGVA